MEQKLKLQIMNYFSDIDIQFNKAIMKMKNVYIMFTQILIKVKYQVFKKKKMHCPSPCGFKPHSFKFLIGLKMLSVYSF